MKCLFALFCVLTSGLELRAQSESAVDQRTFTAAEYEQMLQMCRTQFTYRYTNTPLSIRVAPIARRSPVDGRSLYVDYAMENPVWLRGTFAYQKLFPVSPAPRNAFEIVPRGERGIRCPYFGSGIVTGSDPARVVPVPVVFDVQIADQEGLQGRWAARTFEFEYAMTRDGYPYHYTLVAYVIDLPSVSPEEISWPFPWEGPETVIERDPLGGYRVYEPFFIPVPEDPRAQRLWTIQDVIDLFKDLYGWSVVRLHTHNKPMAFVNLTMGIARFLGVPADELKDQLIHELTDEPIVVPPRTILMVRRGTGDRGDVRSWDVYELSVAH